MGRLAGLGYFDVVRKLRTAGYVFDRRGKGSHELWRHHATGRKVALPRHPGDIPEGTLRAILREAGIESDQFMAL